MTLNSVGIDSGSEDELFMADKEYRRMQERSLTSGYREGMGQASEDGLQEGFDSAYKEGFKLGMEIGKVRGRIAAKKLINVDNQDIIDKLTTIENDLNSLEKDNTRSLQLSDIAQVSGSLDSV